jgi:hypothetical protein
MVALAQLLRDDRGGSVRIQKAVTDDLAHHLVGAPVVGLGTGGLAEQGGGAVFGVQVEQLEVARLGVAEFFGGARRAQPFALALEEHGQFKGDLIIGGNVQRTGGAGQQRVVILEELEHAADYVRSGEKV